MGASAAPEKTVGSKTLSHPCFSCGASGACARIHLPVAPKCNISCNYCVRKFDCPNENRPGVAAHVISPREAAERFAYFRKRVGNLKVVGIAGPGDALANPDETLSTMELIRALDPEVTLCLATNGLALPRFLNDLVDVGVSHVTVTINTLNPATGACICRFVNHMGRILEGEEGAAILLENQLAGVSQLAKQGIACKVNTVALRGVNEDEIASIAADIRRRGAAIHNVMNMIPVAGSAFEDLAPLDDEELNALRDKAAIGIKQMRHCRRCRADAAGTLAHDESISSSWTLDQRRQRCEA